MRLFQSIRLRQKFLIITGIAFLLPLLFFAVFLGVCLISIGEIERESLADEILEVESLVRKRLVELEQAARFIHSETGTERNSTGIIDTVTQNQFLKDWLVRISGIDFAILGDGNQVVSLYTRKVHPGEDNLDHSKEEAFKTLTSTTKSGSGFIFIQGKTYLVHLLSNQDPSSPRVSVLVGIDLNEELFLPINQAAEGHFKVKEICEAEIPDHQEALWITNDSKGNSTIHRSLQGALPGTHFDLQYTSQVGLFDQLRTRLVWFPTFFLGTILLSSLLGTAWATTMVLRPLNRMSTTMAAVAGPEDYVIRVPEDSLDEIGDLATCFNRLMARLEEAQRDLEAAQRTKVETEKLATLHATVITLAHQINNPLAALVGQSELLLLDDKIPQKTRKSLEVIHGMGLRIAEVVKQLQVADTVKTTAYLRTQDMVRIQISEAEEHNTKTPV